MRILVTGATGFIGSHLCNQLHDKHEVIAIGTNHENAPLCSRLMDRPLQDINFGKNRFRGIDVVFHQAAHNDTLDDDEDRMMQANYYAPVRMFHELHLKKCKCFVYASSTAVYGDAPAPYVEDKTPIQPLNVYGKSKARFDEFAMQFASTTRVKVVGLRYCNVYGSAEKHKGHRASMIYKLCKQMYWNHSPVIFRDGNQLRDWIYVQDVVRANLYAMNADTSGIFNCGGGRAYSFNELIQIINEVLGKSLEPTYVDNPHPETYQSHTCCDMSRAKEVLGFLPRYDVKTALAELAAEHRFQSEMESPPWP